MNIGAHVSSAGGISKSIERASAIGAESMQIFVSSPRTWAFKPPSDQEVKSFHEKLIDSAISSVFIHGTYLINLGGESDLVAKSVDILKQHMVVAGRIGSQGVIFHSGSHKGKGFDGVFKQASDALKEVLENSPDDVPLIIENCAGMGAQIGSSFGELGNLLREVDHPNLKICLDTEHAFAAGYDIANREKLRDCMEEFDREIGLDKLVVVHANDSKVVLGGGVDRHENIGDGYIGISGFENIIAHEAFECVPFLLEVPGIHKKGPDIENMTRLKAIRNTVGSKMGCDIVKES